MQTIQKYQYRLDKLYALWVSPQGNIEFSVSEDNGQSWYQSIIIDRYQEGSHLDLEVDELGTVYVVVDTAIERLLYSKKSYQLGFSLAFLDRFAMA